MALTRQRKEETVQKTQEALTQAVSIVFLNFNGLTVVDIGDLRNQLYEAGGRIRVVPKRLLLIALKQANISFDPLAFDGQVAVVWGNDAVAPAKVLNAFTKKNKEKVTILAGVLEGKSLGLAEVTQLAQLPTRDVLLAQLASVLSGAPRGLVTVMSGVQRSFVLAIKAIAEKRG